MQYNDFNPFYERLLTSFHSGFAGKILFSIFLGGIIFAAHFLSIGKVVFENNGWLLSVLIIVEALCLYYATHTFRSLLPQIGTQLNSKDSDIFKDTIHNYLSDGKFIVTGVIFGTLNSMMCFLFGLPSIYNTLSEKAIIQGANFVAGFFCGLAVLGIFGVTKCIVIFSKKNNASFDYTSQDYCGGTQFLGWALIVFSSLSLIVGVLISVCISSAAWENKDSMIVRFLYYSWMTLPYLMSIFVLLIPAISINKALNSYKLDKETQLAKSIRNIINELEDTNIDSGRKSELYKDYEFQTKMRKELHKMRTWPFNISTNLTYFVTIASSIFASVQSVNKWLEIGTGSS